MGTRRHGNPLKLRGGERPARVPLTACAIVGSARAAFPPACPLDPRGRAAADRVRKRGGAVLLAQVAVATGATGWP